MTVVKFGLNIEDVDRAIKRMVRAMPTVQQLYENMIGMKKMAYDPELEEEDDDYFAEVDSEAELTGREPKFVALPTLNTLPAELTAMKVDDLIKMYIDERNQLATDRKGYKSREEKVKTHLTIISMILRDKGETMGVDTFSTPAGTAYRNKKVQFRISLWDSVVDYVKQSGNFQIFQKRLSPNAVKEIIEVDGHEPPGIDKIEIVEFAVRSPTARKKR